MPDYLNVTFSGGHLLAPDFAAVASLSRRLATAFALMQPVLKDGLNPRFQYRYTSYDELAAALREALAQAGLAHLINIQNVQQEPSGTTTKAGDVITRTSLTLGVSLADPDTGAIWTIDGVGEALSSDDKGVNKALTAALKYIWLRAFLTVTADDTADNDGSALTVHKLISQAAAQPASKPSTPPPDSDNDSDNTAEVLPALHAFLSAQATNARVPVPDVHEALRNALGVKSCKEYTGTVAQGQRFVTLWLSKQRLAVPA